MLPALHDMPDAVFVEDPIVVLDECAVVVTLGTAKESIPKLVETGAIPISGDGV